MGSRSGRPSPDSGRTPHYTVVVPTIGRPCLGGLLQSLAAATGPAPDEIIVVDDRRHRADPLELAGTPLPVRVLPSGGRGPAAARNCGWRDARSEWVAFLDDDVEVSATWRADLAEDIRLLPEQAAATQGRISVPLPAGRRPTDWERNVAGLEEACWATADMAYRRVALEDVGGFDERFPRAYREDSDLGLRVTTAGWLILRGERQVTHRVRPAGPLVSLRLQAGNADDVLMRALHGPDWRMRVFAGPGRTGRHVATTLSLLTAAGGALAGRRRLTWAGSVGWAALSSELFWRRVAPGPRTPGEVAQMAATSAVLPLAAVGHMLRGQAGRLRILRRGRWPALGDSEPALPFPTLRARARFGPVPRPVGADPGWEPKAILFDRDGTLIVDRHYLSDPAGVLPLPTARWAVRRARDAGLSLAVVTNQSGVARGLMTRSEMEQVNDRLNRLIGPFGYWAVCCHGPGEGCGCRKPAPGLIQEAAGALGFAPGDCAVIGDIGADVDAARAAGARAVLVPTRRTRPEEIRDAYQVAPDLITAVELVLGGRC